MSFPSNLLLVKVVQLLNQSESEPEYFILVLILKTFTVNDVTARISSVHRARSPSVDSD